MNVNVALDLLVPTVKKLMLVPQVLVQIMAFVLTYLKDMKETHINVYVHMVSIKMYTIYYIPTK